MQLVDNDTFLKQLAALFENNKSQHSIWLTHKRLRYDGEDATMSSPEPEDSKEYPCLVRATDGHDANFSTHVLSSDLERFHSTYGAHLKNSFSTLMRKRDKKREKQKAEAAAARKKRVTESIAVDGPKRGAGRRKRQRKLKALLKQEEAKSRFKEREEEKKPLRVSQAESSGS